MGGWMDLDARRRQMWVKEEVVGQDLDARWQIFIVAAPTLDPSR